MIGRGSILSLAAAILISALRSIPVCGESGTETLHQEDSSKFPSLYKTPVLLDSVRAGIDLAANDHFAETESLFQRLTDTYPNSPIGPLFRAAAIHAEMLDLESPERYPEFALWLRRAHFLSSQWRERDPLNAEPELLLGIAEGYDAVYESRWGGWFAALKKGLRSKNRFNDAFSKDSTLIDALIGIGNYDYWKADKTDVINWLPMIPDNRKKGLEALHQVAVSGVICRAAARGSLVWALINEGRYDEALAHADTLALEAPEGKAPLWMKGSANFRLYRWEEALALYQEIAERIESTGAGNYFNLIECAYFEAQCLYGAGRYAEAAGACHKGLSYPAPEEIRKRQSGKIGELRDLQKHLKKLLAKS